MSAAAERTAGAKIAAGADWLAPGATDRLCGAAIAGTPSTAGVTWAMADCWPKASVEPPISVRKNAPTTAAPRFPKSLINVVPFIWRSSGCRGVISRRVKSCSSGMDRLALEPAKQSRLGLTRSQSCAVQIGEDVLQGNPWFGE